MIRDWLTVTIVRRFCIPNLVSANEVSGGHRYDYQVAVLH